MEKGDVVKLVVGGPDMVINAIDLPHVYCQWFVGTTLIRGDFAPELLELVRSVSGRTHVVQIMDGSGSMSRIWDEINGMLQKQFDVHKKAALDGQDIRITTFVFDNEIYPPVVSDADPKFVTFPELTMPGGMTALRDAIGTGIKLAKKQFADNPGDAVLVQIFTDGQENNSKEWSHKSINAEIVELQRSNKWTFQFIGADQIAEDTARDFGIFVANAIRFDPTKGGVRGMSDGLSRTTQSYYSARGAGAQSVSNSFGDELDKRFEEETIADEAETD